MRRCYQHKNRKFTMLDRPEFVFSATPALTIGTFGERRSHGSIPYALFPTSIARNKNGCGSIDVWLWERSRTAGRQAIDNAECEFARGGLFLRVRGVYLFPTTAARMFVVVVAVMLLSWTQRNNDDTAYLWKRICARVTTTQSVNQPSPTHRKCMPLTPPQSGEKRRKLAKFNGGDFPSNRTSLLKRSTHAR